VSKANQMVEYWKAAFVLQHLMYMAQQLLAMYHSMKFQRMQQDRKRFTKYAHSRTMIFVIHFPEPKNLTREGCGFGSRRRSQA
jgi:hypothetical protein